MRGACPSPQGAVTLPKESDGYVRAIERGFALIEALGRSPGRHTLSEAAVHAGLNRATARRMLATLVTLKYCEADGRYFRLRPRALGLGLSYLNALHSGGMHSGLWKTFAMTSANPAPSPCWMKPTSFTR